MSDWVVTFSDREEKLPYVQILLQADTVKKRVHIEVEDMDKDSHKTLHGLVLLGKSFYTSRNVCVHEILRYIVSHYLSFEAYLSTGE